MEDGLSYLVNLSARMRNHKDGQAFSKSSMVGPGVGAGDNVQSGSEVESDKEEATKKGRSRAARLGQPFAEDENASEEEIAALDEEVIDDFVEEFVDRIIGF